MRKQNAEFKTAFTSEANKNLKNTDYFGFVELDQCACYVIADGIDDGVDAIGAKLAIDTIIAKFTEAPSMKKNTIRACLKAANTALLQAKSKMKLKVSVTMVVTDYAKMRYGQSGNTRLRLYRSGHIKMKSKDHSLSMDLVEDRKMEEDMLAKHEERNNLYTYLGQKTSFHPYISKKTKLLAADSLALYTSGIWESLDEGELEDVFAEAADEPQATVDLMEDLLLSKQLMELEKYTFVTVFINKTFADPNSKRKIKRMVMIAIPILVIAVTITIILLIRHNQKMDRIETMNQRYFSTIEYMQADNYIRAEGEAKKAKELAEGLKDVKMIDEIGKVLLLAEIVIAADENLDAKKYADAQQSYQKAASRSRYADNIGKDYINERLERTANYLSVYDLISLGDTLAFNLQFDEAEQKYLEAKALAGKIYFEEGRTSATSALEKLYGDKKKLDEEKEKEVLQGAADQIAGTNSMALGDTAFAKGDYEGAKVYYATALQKYSELGSELEAEAVGLKIEETNRKIGERTEREKTAEDYIVQAEKALQAEEKDYVSAKKYYLLAKDIYSFMKNDDRVSEMERRIDLLEENETDLKKDTAEKDKEAAEAASSIESGDASYAAGDYGSALRHYKAAWQSYVGLGLEADQETVSLLIEDTKQKKKEYEEQEEEARGYLEKADEYMQLKEYQAVKKYYLLAKQVYSSIRNENKIDEINRKLEQLEFEQEMHTIAVTPEVPEQKQEEQTEDSEVQNAEPGDPEDDQKTVKK